MILLLDNYDSFTFNLYQALSELGAEVLVRRNDMFTVEDVEELVPMLDGIVISPGPCTPGEAGISVPLVRRLAGTRSSGDRRGVRREDYPRAETDARQGFNDRARRRWRSFRTAKSISSHQISLAHRRAGNPTR
jgi:hypothetical protein